MLDSINPVYAKRVLSAVAYATIVFTFFACSSDESGETSPASSNRVFENVFIAEGVNFMSGKAEIADNSFAYLTNIAEVMKTHPEVTFRIVGHTDNVGNPEANQKLSEARAKAVMDFLISRGVGAKCLEYQGKGQDSPIESNNTDAGRAKNRRIEIHYDGDFDFLPEAGNSL